MTTKIGLLPIKVSINMGMRGEAFAEAKQEPSGIWVVSYGSEDCTDFLDSFPPHSTEGFMVHTMFCNCMRIIAGNKPTKHRQETMHLGDVVTP